LPSSFYLAGLAKTSRSSSIDFSTGYHKNSNGLRDSNVTLSEMPSSLPAKFIQTTTFKPRTLNPVWKERFKFDCEDFPTDILHLDIWDHDFGISVREAVSKLNEVKTLKGLNRYFKQVTLLHQ